MNTITKKQFKLYVISVIADKEWYASLMLNRLMFCYFIQKKGFLDNNLNYLKEKLSACQQKKGKDKFYVSFYKNFLLALFHKGLGSPDHSEELKKEFGKIPYLNGGLFDIHYLEKEYKDIDIGDEAFSNIFKFFDQYNWHLDTDKKSSGKDIDPDVIGYIFEKFINDRAKMGAYYTKEDITDYISKNCIIPYLFDCGDFGYAQSPPPLPPERSRRQRDFGCVQSPPPPQRSRRQRAEGSVISATLNHRYGKCYRRAEILIFMMLLKKGLIFLCLKRLLWALTRKSRTCLSAEKHGINLLRLSLHCRLKSGVKWLTGETDTTM